VGWLCCLNIVAGMVINLLGALNHQFVLD